MGLGERIGEGVGNVGDDLFDGTEMRQRVRKGGNIDVSWSLSIVPTDENTKSTDTSRNRGSVTSPVETTIKSARFEEAFDEYTFDWFLNTSGEKKNKIRRLCCER